MKKMHKGYSGLDAVTAPVYSCWSYDATHVEPTQTPP
jgi:hypothetical protein